MTLQELQAKIEQGSYRSDRFPAVPFTTADMAANAASKPIKTTAQEWLTKIATPDAGSILPKCGATLTIGAHTQVCGLYSGHVQVGVEHDWAASL